MKRVGFVCVLGFMAAAAAAKAAPSVRSAEVRIAFASPTSCTVELTLAVDADEVEHRLDAPRGGRIELIEVRGAGTVRGPADVGQTKALVLRPEAQHYTLRYAVELPPERAGRCPLWIPTVPTEGRGQAVRIVARIPAGATAVGTMPAFSWSGGEGTATIGHLPAFVRVPYAMPGAPAPWNIAMIMDGASLATLAGATLAWVRYRRRLAGLAAAGPGSEVSR
jgi:hypothetical protein